MSNFADLSNKVFDGKALVTAPGTPVQLDTAGQNFTSIEIYAQKGQGAANVGIVYLGFQSGAGKQYRPLNPGETFTYTMSGGAKGHTADIWIDAVNANDGATFVAIP